MGVVVILMVFFRLVKVGKRTELRYDGIIEIGLHLADDFFGHCLLPGIVKKDGGAVLGAPVCPLPVQRCRVMGAHENDQQLPVGDHRGVKNNAHHLGVPGPSRTDFPVRWLSRYCAPAISGYYCLYPPDPLEDRLGTPETSPSDSRLSQLIRVHGTWFFPVQGPVN